MFQHNFFIQQVIYFDGHERPDVVEYRQQFCKEYLELEKDSVHMDIATLQPINLGSKYLVVVQDETSKNTDEGKGEYKIVVNVLIFFLSFSFH